MKTIFDLPEDLVEDEIISKLPISSLRSVRSTCKKWNTLCKNRIFLGKEAEAKKQFLLMDSRRICLMNLDLSKKGEPSIRQVSVLDQIQISKVFHCEGLLLCLLKDCSRLVVWNPYLGQTRWIEPRTSFQRGDRFSLGYKVSSNNLNHHKILRISYENHYPQVLGFELYDFSTSSWKVLDFTPEGLMIWSHARGISLRGNTYFPTIVRGSFLCFDFTAESFGPLLPLPPFHSYHGLHFASFSCVREEEKLAMLYQHWEARETIEISVTDKIGPDVVSWTKFLKLVTSFSVRPYPGSFFIDEEKKIAGFFVLESVNACRYQTAHVIGQDGYFKSERIRDASYLKNTSSPHSRFYPPVLVCSSYFPSLVQLQINQPA